MSKPKVKKISKLIIPESFIQVHTLKGFKYIDRAGEIVNHYHKDNKPPVFNMNLTGLTIKEPTDEITELKITPDFIWAKFSNVSSLHKILKVYLENLKVILAVLEVEEAVRVGWRTYFIYELKNKTKLDTFLSSINPIDNSELSAIRTIINPKPYIKVNLNIEPVVKQAYTNQYAVVFDTDIFLKKEIIKVEDIDSILESFKEYFFDKEGIIKTINEVLK